MVKKETQTEILARAKKLGKAGFKAGKIAPAQDAKHSKMIKDYAGNNWAKAIKITKAYNKGWQEEQTKYSNEILRKQGWNI